MTAYAEFCGRTLARAHARSGDVIAIARYLVQGGRLPRAAGDARYCRFYVKRLRDFSDGVGG